MANKMRSVFTSVSDTFFPGSKSIIDGGKEKSIMTGSYVNSSLWLQMSLYFNCYFSPFWLVICLIVLTLKFEKLNPYYQFILAVIYLVMGGLEVLRLFLGYLGNLLEKVPELAGFWLVTVILQLPLCCILLFNEATLILPFERAVNIIMFVFLVTETIHGYIAIKRMTDSQVEKFRMRRLYGLDADSESSHVIKNEFFKKNL
ncbi:transmembrane protein 17B isoform X1 [Hydra vulgaris]|uniref:transmembrane protein 17B isoform X1 n=1 Tax=Hydra vulgaris TaxID=6087 RepID=UPI001F5F9300|nr:transmembrane protein 17B isoform X1 [Hydra vulgaris]